MFSPSPAADSHILFLADKEAFIFLFFFLWGNKIMKSVKIQPTFSVRQSFSGIKLSSLAALFISTHRRVCSPSSFVMLQEPISSRSEGSGDEQENNYTFIRRPIITLNCLFWRWSCWKSRMLLLICNKLKSMPFSKRSLSELQWKGCCPQSVSVMEKELKSHCSSLTLLVNEAPCWCNWHGYAHNPAPAHDCCAVWRGGSSLKPDRWKTFVFLCHCCCSEVLRAAERAFVTFVSGRRVRVGFIFTKLNI